MEVNSNQLALIQTSIRPSSWTVDIGEGTRALSSFVSHPCRLESTTQSLLISEPSRVIRYSKTRKDISLNLTLNPYRRPNNRVVCLMDCVDKIMLKFEN